MRSCRVVVTAVDALRGSCRVLVLVTELVMYARAVEGVASVAAREPNLQFVVCATDSSEPPSCRYESRVSNRLLAWLSPQLSSPCTLAASCATSILRRKPQRRRCQCAGKWPLEQSRLTYRIFMIRELSAGAEHGRSRRALQLI